jgi:hypothetical protein
MASLVGFAWNKAASMGVDVIAVESTAHLSFEPQPSVCIFPLHFCYHLNCNFYRNNTSRYGSDLCTLYFRNQLSECVTYVSRTFIKCSEYYTAFWHFPWRSYSFHTFEDQWSTENTEEIFNFRKATLLFPLKKLIIPKKSERINKEINQRAEGNGKCKEFQYFRSNRSENAEKRTY